MQRNQWSRRKPSTKPEESRPDEAGLEGAGSDDGQPGDGSLGQTPPDGAADGEPGRSAASSPRKIAFDILARREHSVLELREKLLAREFPPDEVEQTIEALLADGLLNEQRFIDSFLASYTRRGHGPLWLRAELERRGITSAEIAVALASQEIAGQPVDWPAQARAVREKRFGPAQPADYKDRARQSRFLQYRGFSSEQLRQAFTSDDED
jgi:regulatory protein